MPRPLCQMPAWRRRSSESLPAAEGGAVWEPRQVGHLQAPAPWCPPRPPPPRARCGWGPVLTLGAGRREAGAQELPAGFSLLGELEDEEDEDDEKLTPVRPGGLVAVFCPVRLFRHTGQLSCCCSQGTMQPSWKR